MKLQTDIGEKIKALRKRCNLTLEAVGKQVGVSKSTVRKWETGQIANIRLDKIVPLAKALGVTPQYLAGWDDSPHGA
jgi:repressor LexA